MAISRMQQPRQMYGLGSIVKKAVRGVKKIVKSPLGKAALLGTAANFAPMLFGKGTLMSQAGGLSGLKSRFMSGKGFLGGVGNIFGKEGDITKGLSMGRVGLGALGAASIAPLFMGGDNDEVEEQVTQLDPIGTVQSARNYYSGLGDQGAGLNFMPKKKYVSQNFYAADGGRAGYANGQLVTPSGDGSRPGYAGVESLFRKLPGNTNDRFLMPENVPPRNKKFDFMFETGPITDRNLEILKNMTEEERRLFEEQGSPFDIIEKFINIPFQIRGEEIIKEKYAQGGRAGYANGMMVEDDEDEIVRMQASQRMRPAQTFLNMGGDAGNAQAEQMLMAEFIKYKNKGGDLSFQQFVKAVMQQQEQAQGMQQPMMAANGGPVPGSEVAGYTTPAGYNKFDYRSGGVRVNAAEGGIMETEEASEMIDMGGQEKDYRDEGGFVAMGGEERADDVPARLSKNEFVFTADAVRNAGGGDIDRGSEVMQNLMDNLEQGGQVSEDSQGLGGGEEMMSEEMIEEPNGAQAMYEQQQALQSRIA